MALDADAATFPEPIAVISPHCDDAVFSCGALLARHPGSTAITVFAGDPPAGQALTDWDRAARFTNGLEAMAVRRSEDRAALSSVSAEASWLDFCDDQYGRDDSPEAIAASIESRLGTARTVLVPLGLFHADHILTYRASAMLVAVDMRRCWIGYEDALYRSFSTLLCERVASLRAGGCLGERIARCENVDAMRMKRRAMACYRSQLRALSRVGVGHMDALAPEGYWRLHSVTG